MLNAFYKNDNVKWSMVNATNPRCLSVALKIGLDQEGQPVLVDTLQRVYNGRSADPIRAKSGIFFAFIFRMGSRSTFVRCPALPLLSSFRHRLTEALFPSYGYTSLTLL